MKLNPEYLKKLLEAFEKARGPYTDYTELESFGFDRADPNFVFHGDLLVDKGLVENCGDSRGLGYKLHEGGRLEWWPVPLRMTAAGHEFIADLNQSDVWQTIKDNFQESGFETLKTVAADLALGFAKKKVGEYLAA